MRPPTFLHRLSGRIELSRTHTWLVAVSFATACFVTVCYVGWFIVRADADRRAESLASGVATAAAYEVARMIERFDQALQTTIERLASAPVSALDPGTRSLVLFDRARALSPLGFINVLDETGKVVEAADPSALGSRWASRDYFVVQRNGPSPSLYVSRPFGQGDSPSVALSRRLSKDDGSFAGVAVASLRLSAVRSLFGQMDVGARGTIALFQKDGTLLMRLPFDRNDVGRTRVAEAVPDGAVRLYVQRQVGDLPLYVRVGVTPADLLGASQIWIVVILAAGAVLGCLSLGLIAMLAQETRRRAVAERHDRHKSDYLAMATRQLRAPMECILENADRLRVDASRDAISARSVAAITDATRRLREVIERTLDHLQVDWRLPTPRMGRIDLSDVLERCCIMVESDATARGIELHYGFKSGAPEQFVTDGHLLTQILMNLLSNATKYTERGSISLEVAGSEDRMTIEVTDTGCGISPAARHALFRRGERLDMDGAGQGIGLAMTQRLVQSLGGEIGYRENPAGGSIFWVGLPAGTLVRTGPREASRAVAVAEGAGIAPLVVPVGLQR